MVINWSEVKRLSDMPISDEKNCYAKDGWSIHERNGTYLFCSVDPGHGGSHLEVTVQKDVNDFARERQPSWEEICRLLKGKGYF